MLFNDFNVIDNLILRTLNAQYCNMHNELLPEVVQAIKDLDSGKIECYVDVYYLEVPQDKNSPHRKCIIVLRKLRSGWRICDRDNFQLID